MAALNILAPLQKIEYGEKFNTYSHAVGGCVSLVGALLLLAIAVIKQDPTRLIAFFIYSITTVGLYFVSALYHGSSGSHKNFLRHLDYLGIYLKIAGNYTPYALIALSGLSQIYILITVWSLALFGVCWELLTKSKIRAISFATYGVMSISVIPVLRDLIQSIPPLGFTMILMGYISYAIGVFFFANDERIKHGHGIWHMFVIGGTTLHYFCILFYLT